MLNKDNGQSYGLKKRFTGKVNPTKKPNPGRNRSSNPDKPLTDRAWLMVKHYASMEKPSIFQAYLQAGYEGRGNSAGVSANEIFYSANFQKALQVEMELRDKLFRVDAAMVIRNLSLMANANMKDFGSWEHDSFVLKSSEELTRDVAYAISEIKRNTRGEVTIKLESRMRANELLATHLGILVPDPAGRKDISETAAQIREAVEALNGSVPTKPPEEEHDIMGTEDSPSPSEEYEPQPVEEE